MISSGSLAFSCDAPAPPVGCWPAFLLTWTSLPPVIDDGGQAAGSLVIARFHRVRDALLAWILKVLAKRRRDRAQDRQMVSCNLSAVFLRPSSAAIGRWCRGTVSRRFDGHRCLHLSCEPTQPLCFGDVPQNAGWGWGQVFSKPLRVAPVRRQRNPIRGNTTMTDRPDKSIASPELLTSNSRTFSDARPAVSGMRHPFMRHEYEYFRTRDAT